MAATLSSKCQVTIPKKIREHLGLKPGSKVDFVVRDHGVQFVSCDEQASRKAAVEMIRRTAGLLHKYVKNNNVAPRESDDAILDRVAREIAHEGRRR